MKINGLDFSAFFKSSKTKQYMLYSGLELPNIFNLGLTSENLIPEFRKMDVEQILSVFIKLYISTYPNGFLNFLDFIAESYTDKVTAEHKAVYESVEVYNKDIKNVKWSVVTIPNFYDVEFGMAFPNCVFIEQIEFILKKQVKENVIKESLKGFEYERREEDGNIVFLLSESALKRIVMGSENLILEINPDKFFYYGN